ncbi:helix-turn-helix transcriptional regulator [Gordonia sp. CPCC 205515]|uniref:helix-turn-helix transcriptional regulator n=1 Tax=Gordonia sp. CPCC 205515 TaxID=3140791 RepID=UPI003AF3EFD4
MTVIAHHIPAHHTAHRRQAEATRRRQEALARLAQRRMPLPGQQTPGRPAAHMTVVTSSATRTAVEGPRCTCHTASGSLPRPALTEREIEVLRSWLKLDSKPEVAAELYISLGTVNTHLTRIRAKYSDVGRAAPTKAALVARAVQDGLISLDEL